MGKKSLSPSPTFPKFSILMPRAPPERIYLKERHHRLGLISISYGRK